MELQPEVICFQEKHEQLPDLKSSITHDHYYSSTNLSLLWETLGDETFCEEGVKLAAQ